MTKQIKLDLDLTYPSFNSNLPSIYPELGANRYYKRWLSSAPEFVVPIQGKLWSVLYEPLYSNGVPSGGTLTFTETEAVETPYLTEEPEGRCDMKFFGQPTFIQGEVYFHLDGKLVYPLLTSESYWGDAGNENVFIALDSQGLPIKAWQESSCC